jgi:hypothetical protein
MLKFAHNLTAAQLIESLQQKGLIEDSAQIQNFCLEKKQNQPEPLKLLIGIGVFLIAIFLVGFLVFIWGSIFDSYISAIFNQSRNIGPSIGAILLVVGAILIQKLTDAAKVKHFSITFTSVLFQFSFAAMAAGKFLFVANFSEWIQLELWGLAFSIFLMTCFTYPFYKLPSERFISCTLTLVCTYHAIASSVGLRGNRGLIEHVDEQLLLIGLFAVGLFVSNVLLFKNRLSQGFVPLAHACVAGLFYMSAALQFESANTHLIHHGAFNLLWIINGLIGTSMISSILIIRKDVKQFSDQAVIAACVGVVLLSISSIAGILLALNYIIIGYAKQHTKLILVASIFLILFVSGYYYAGMNVFYYDPNEITLLEKAEILIANGVLFLLGWLYIKYKGWDTYEKYAH